MKIAYYMPFKPMHHVNPSGDLVIGTELHDHLAGRGHQMSLASRLRCRWIYYRPLTLLRLLMEKNRITEEFSKKNNSRDLWLSYHSYYKAPDLLGALCARKLAIPYVIFQGIYSTKRRKKLKTLPGFLLNRRVLLSADHIFTNKQRDYKNLRRLLPENRLSYIAPGIKPRLFEFSIKARKDLRLRYASGNETLILSTAMMRPGVKSEGLRIVINSCGELIKEGQDIKLLIVGDGSERQALELEACQILPGRTHFLGKIPREELYKYYSCADIFAFPGIEESLGMVYLEAQSCRLPVVAYQDWGGGEAVLHERTGLISPAAEPSRFTSHIRYLVGEKTVRKTLAEAAEKHIRKNHNLEKNYHKLEQKLLSLTKKY